WPYLAAGAGDDRALSCTVERVLPEVKIDRVALTDVLDFMRDVEGIKIRVDWYELERVNVRPDSPVTVDLKHATMTQALAQVLNAAGGGGEIVFYVDDGVLVITTRIGACLIS